MATSVAGYACSVVGGTFASAVEATAVCCGMGLPSPGQSVLATFDDLTGDTSTASLPIPTPYLGLSWQNAEQMNATQRYSFCPSGTVGYINGVVTSPRVAFNAFANPAAFYAPSGKSLYPISVWATAAWRDNLSVTFTGLNAGGNPIPGRTVTTTIQFTGPTLIDLSTLGVVQGVGWVGSGGTAHPSTCTGSSLTHVVLDNVQVVIGRIHMIVAVHSWPTCLKHACVRRARGKCAHAASSLVNGYTTNY